ncbi:MAG: hypothetical protein H0V12_04300 [Chloroflexi bacterium]|nr:hypothetical protein [Chloroflexota bacterium]
MSTAEGDSGTTDLTFTVTLSAAAEGTETVDFDTADGTATAPSDYTARSGTLTFTAGETSQTITVSVNGDTDVESDETFFVDLSDLSLGADAIEDGRGRATIRNDDEAEEPPPPTEPPALRIDDVQGAEGDTGTTPFLFTVTRTGDTSSESSVRYRTTNGTATAPSDYTAIANTTLIFTPGQTSTTITVAVNGDTDVEPDERFFVDLSSPINATIADSRGRGTILNDDDEPEEPPPPPSEVPNLRINNVRKLEGHSGTTPFTFTVTRSGDTSRASSVRYHTVEDTATVPQDFVPLSDGLLRFRAGQTSRTITIQVKGDGKRAPDEIFYLQLREPSGATIQRGRGMGTIVNDDPFLTIADASVRAPSTGRGVRHRARACSSRAGARLTMVR